MTGEQTRHIQLYFEYEFGVRIPAFVAFLKADISVVDVNDAGSSQVTCNRYLP